MTRTLAVSLLAIAFASAAFAQKSASSFPGVSAEHLKQLQIAKRSTSLPLPSWVPTGFTIEKIEMKLGAKVPIEERGLVIIYSRPAAAGKTQRFALEAGFDGLGDLPYDSTKIVRSGLGRISLAYEPADLDDNGKKLKNFAMTEWFKVGKTDFHYIGSYGAEEGDTSLAMISLADTEKILRSLKLF